MADLDANDLADMDELARLGHGASPAATKDLVAEVRRLRAIEDAAQAVLSQVLGWRQRPRLRDFRRMSRFVVDRRDGMLLDTHMTKTQQLTEATRNRDEARRRMEGQPRWNAAKRDAAEDLEFWGSKVAFLAAWIAQEGE